MHEPIFALQSLRFDADPFLFFIVIVRAGKPLRPWELDVKAWGPKPCGIFHRGGGHTCAVGTLEGLGGAAKGDDAPRRGEQVEVAVFHPAQTPPPHRAAG